MVADKRADVDSDIAGLGFEDALKQLEAIVARLEKGDVGLEDSIAAYERGEKLKTRCAALLADAEMRVERIALDAQGRPKGVAPLDPG
ncbi:MAG: exodeoxyribonuclease VII small subunit [Hyphomicrobiales bacterium]|nr:exodeoxyribonuclease VII small subunit [Hyphomicrobiales bacterium]MDE2017043.1 exodeoxyribonuclease VII small subunit [Hyphomicrobiales bacterium]